jgi:hypothetical protein
MRDEHAHGTTHNRNKTSEAGHNGNNLQLTKLMNNNIQVPLTTTLTPSLAAIPAHPPTRSNSQFPV